MFTSTFYSFKGGVGRTLSLINVAYELVARGNKVTVIDFDLEAPGMQTFSLFKNAFNKNKTLKISGVADYINDYVASLSKKPEIPKISNYLYKVPKADFKKIKNTNGALWFMPASKLLTKETVQNINWFDLYENQNGFLLFEELKLQIKDFTDSDYLLIDSRTGLTDHSSICTRQLPDLLAVVFFPNDQNIVGLKDVVKEANSNKIFIASRLPPGDDEFNILENQLKKAKKTLKYDDTSLFSNFTKLTHNSNVNLLRQELSVSNPSKNIQLKNEYLQLVDLIEFNNNNSLIGNLNFLENVNQFLFFISSKNNEKENQKHIAETFVNIESRINYILENQFYNEDVMLNFDRVVSSVGSLDEDESQNEIIVKSNFYKNIYRNGNFIRFYIPFTTFCLKSHKLTLRDSSVIVSRLRNLIALIDIRALFKMSFQDLFKLSFPYLNIPSELECKFLKYNKLEKILFKSIEIYLESFLSSEKSKSDIDYTKQTYVLTSFLILSVMDFEKAFKKYSKKLMAYEFKRMSWRRPLLNIFNKSDAFEISTDVYIPFEINNLVKCLILKNNSISYIYQKIKNIDSIGQYDEVLKSILVKFNSIKTVNCDFESGLLLFFRYLTRSLNHRKARPYYLRNAYFDDFIKEFEGNNKISFEYYENRYEEKLSAFLFFIICKAYNFVGELEKIENVDAKLTVISEEDNDYFPLVPEDFRASISIVSPFNGKLINYNEVVILVQKVTEVKNFLDLVDLFDPSLLFIKQTKNK